MSLIPPRLDAPKQQSGVRGRQQQFLSLLFVIPNTACLLITTLVRALPAERLQRARRSKVKPQNQLVKRVVELGG